MVVALSPAVTIPGAILTGGIGGVLVVLGPVFVVRLQRHRDASAPAAAPWLALFLCEFLAAVLLFSAGNAFSLIPAFATTLKIGIIALATLCLSMGWVLVLALRRGPP